MAMIFFPNLLLVVWLHRLCIFPILLNPGSSICFDAHLGNSIGVNYVQSRNPLSNFST